MSPSIEDGYSKARGRISNMIAEMNARIAVYPHHLTGFLRKMAPEEAAARNEAVEKAR
jgi:hypothetical protein